MSLVQIPQKTLRELQAMTRALVRQGHLHVISLDMPRGGGGGLQPSAPIFLIPKTVEKCSFIINCKTGNKRDPVP